MTTDRPDETEAQRADRNFSDLLQELRVAQTGVQILFAFLLTIPMQARFEKLNEYQKDVFVAALLCTALATACFVAPVSYHRVLFRRRMKDHIVRAANRFAAIGLLFLALSVVICVHLVLDLVLNLGIAIGVGVALAALLLLLWWILPVSQRRKQNREPGGDDDGR
jgi:Flp pilus assembly protein TadB